MKCAKCDKSKAVKFKGERYQIYLCNECYDKFRTWFEGEEILDLEAQVKSLSDILVEKDHKIIDLEADKERLTRSWQNELVMNGKIRKELREYKAKCARQEAAIRCKDGMIIELANQREKHA